MEQLNKFLPAQFVHEIVEYKPEENGFSAKICCNCSTEEDFEQWMNDYQKLTLTSWIVRNSAKPQVRISFRKDYVCRLSNHRHKENIGIRTLARNCTASVSVKIKIDSKWARRTDKYSKVIDRSATSVLPRSNTVYYWHECWRKENFGDRDGDEMWRILETKVNKYRADGTAVTVQKDPYVVTIITPLMRRAHSLSTSKEIIFVESTSSCDDGHHVITFLLCRCPIGAIPVGVIITNGQSEEHYRNGFEAFRDVIGETGFNRNTAPDVFMTDDSDAERNALKAIWPNSAIAQGDRGSHTNNFVESAIRLSKDTVLRRFFTSSNNTRPYLLLEQALAAAKNISEDAITHIGCEFYRVKSETSNETYTIDSVSGACTCKEGSFGAFCKHQAALHRLKKIGLPNAPAVTATDRCKMAKLALGDSAKNMEFYCRLDEPPVLGLVSNECRENDTTAVDTNRSESAPGDDHTSFHQDLSDHANATRAVFQGIAEQLQEVESKCLRDKHLLSDAKMFFSRLKRLKTASQTSTFLRTAGASLGIYGRSVKRIRTQPMSISRRQSGKSKTSNRLPSGRPSKKRKHDLALNVENNQLNAI